MSASGQIVRFLGDLLKLIAALLIATVAVDTAFWFLAGMHGGFSAYPYTQGNLYSINKQNFSPSLVLGE